MSSISLAFCFAAVAGCFVVVSSSVQIYTVTTVPAGAPSIPSWALYDSSARLFGNKSAASFFDDGPVYDPIGGFCMPYFQMDSVSFFISPNGYLAMQPTSQCPAMCSNGDYGFANFLVNSSAYGNFAMVGLFVFDLNPSSGQIPGDAQSNAIYKRVFQRLLDDGTGGTVSMKVALVEYYKVLPYGKTNVFVTAAAELWENGTIILRFQQVFNLLSSNYFLPSTGIIWTPAQRVSTEYVRFVNSSVPANFVAIRYEPTINKTCSVHVNCSSCSRAGRNTSTEYLEVSDCVWCGSSQQCVPYGIASDFCGPSDRNVCLQNETIFNSTSSGNAQPFYRSKIVRQATWIDIRDNATQVTNANQNVSLGFNFSFFYNPPNRTTNNSRTTSEVTLMGGNFLSILSSTQPCFVDVYGLCGNGDYSFSIVPFGTVFLPKSGQTIHFKNLEARSNGDLFCPPSGLTSSTTCGRGIVFQFSKWIQGAQQMTSFQAYLDESGVVALHFHEAFDQDGIGNGGGDFTDCVNGSRTIWNTYYGPYIGLYRDGASDLSSATFPWSEIERDTRVIFTPVEGCPDCSGNGACNLSARVCMCSPNYAGETCSECAPGYYGPSCAICSGCAHGGVCDDGKDGSGYCKCTLPYSGKNCTDVCTGSRDCVDGCGQGYCLCGKCVCDTQFGWSGEVCDEWEDPCPQWSLDGCSTCVAQTSITCNFCRADRVCFAANNQAVRIGSTTTACNGQYYTPSTASTCVTNKQSPPPDSTFAIITVIVVFACLGVCACLTLITVCACRKRPPNPHSISAVPGVPDFAFPHREREIMGVSRLPIQGKSGRPVQGIPLKQIQLSQLVKIQREARARASDPSNSRKVNFPELSEAETDVIRRGIPVYVD